MCTTMIKLLCSVLIVLLLTGCEKPPFYVANIGNAGSLDGPYYLVSISVSDVLGGGGGFGYGAVNGYPGASADIGRMGVPKHIEGYWAKEKKETLGFEAYYRIAADIDSELAEQKIRTLRNYYKDFSSINGFMQVVVEQERIRIIYTQGCYKHNTACLKKKGADPHGWVVRSPSDTTEVVVLFDGKGEVSAVPFAGSPYDR